MNQFFEKLLSHLENIYQSVETFQKIFQVLKKLWNKITYVIVLGYITVFILQFETFRNYIIKITDNPQIVNWIFDKTNIILFLLQSVIIIAFIYKVWKIGKIDILKYDNFQDFVKQIHIKLIHDVRDNIKELDSNIKELNKNNEDITKIIKSKMFQDLSNNMQTYVDFLAEYLSKYCNTTISTCIKIVKFENCDSDNPEAITLTRSSNTRNMRLKNEESIFINQNDDFKYLYNGANTFYGKADLIKEHNNGNYHVQDSIEKWSNKYKSTLIAPIRYYSKHSKHNNIDVEFDILGFLCIDANKVMEKWEDIDSFELGMLAIFADTMYIYLKRYKEVYCKND